MTQIRLSRLAELLAESRGDIRLTNEALAEKIAEGLGIHHDGNNGSKALNGEIPVVVAKDLRAVNVSPRLMEAFSMAHLHELWAEFLGSQTL